MRPIIEVKNLSKKYQIGIKQPYYSLRDTLVGFAKNPFVPTRHKKVNNEGLAEDEFWALKNISLNVMSGETIGIIGRNGAGKTTLLKLLSQITPPTEGEIILRGRVASLLEVGTGFHPELTGRENIYLNGAILGMKRVEIKRKFDEIVDFAEIERFLDTPVKHYSSGMYMRLAFAVAAHLEPEILIVDEVLAVGDAAFQKKCLGKMENISQKGKTVLFVSHNMSAVKKLCSRGILLQEGEASKMMDVDKLIDLYQSSRSNITHSLVKLANQGIEFKNFQINGGNINLKPEVFPNETLRISFDYRSLLHTYDLCISIGLRSKSDGTLLVYTHNHLENIKHKTRKHGKVEISFFLPPVAPGDYFLELQIWLDSHLVVNEYEVGEFKIVAIPFFASSQTFSSFPAHLLLNSTWEFRPQ